MGESYLWIWCSLRSLTHTRALKLYRPRARILPERLHLRSLACDADSLERCINVYLGLEAERTGSAATPGSLTNLEKLDLSISDSGEQDAHIPLLKQTSGLRDLAITSKFPYYLDAINSLNLRSYRIFVHTLIPLGRKSPSPR